MVMPSITFKVCVETDANSKYAGEWCIPGIHWCIPNDGTSTRDLWVEQEVMWQSGD